MLKLINIPNIVYDWLANGFPNEDDVEHILEILRGGITLSDNATNGDVITEILKSSNDMHSTRNIGLVQEDTIYIEVGSNWWNSPYK